MKTLIGVIVAITWGAIAATCANARPLSPTDFVGHWAIKAEGQNLMVLTLDLPAGTDAITGVLFRPMHMNLTGTTVTSVSLPVTQERVVKAYLNSEGLHLGFQDASGSISEFQMDLKGSEAADLKFVGVPVPALPLVRVGKDAEIAKTWDIQHAYALGDIETDNARMTQLFEDDQADRKRNPPIDPNQLVSADAQRRQITVKMLHQGDLRTGLDFLHAAFIFQHGDQPKEFLLAHALALSALEMGRADAGWIAAASLDRYLVADGKPQIYGTQFALGQEQSPLDRDLIPDALRLRMGVPALEDQHTPTVQSTNAALHCAPIVGDTPLWKNTKIRYIIVGETHGTAEEPSLFADLVCAAHASGRAVMIAVEEEEDEQSAIDAYLASDGGPVAKETFLHSPLWHLSIKDGRSSQAYFDLFERLRLYRQSGIIVGVAAIQPVISAQGTTPNINLNLAMAERIRISAAQHPNALVLVLVGNMHARKKPITFGAQTITPAASYLPPEETISLMIMTGGMAWNCIDGECGVHAFLGTSPTQREIKMGVDAPSGFDGVIDLGQKTTASFPVTSQ